MIRLMTLVLVAVLLFVVTVCSLWVKGFDTPTAAPVTVDVPTASPDATVPPAKDQGPTPAALSEASPRAEILANPTPTTELPTVEPAPNPDSRETRTVSSTGYCETGRMADGEYAHDGAVSSKVLPRGSSWRVLDGPLEGRTFVVEDTGPGAYFDVSMPGDCDGARAYGRHSIQIEAVG